ncbi:hypothetical protein ACQKKK_17145 [Peribacillus sp. NPDC006672]|uniref:hypothetical protein n=1 Tax=Peribacillus sp. NPDC006672 TaxID=3390606 RepID=UPI003D05BA09
MKKLTGVLLSIVFALSMFFPFTGGDSASAATTSNDGFIVSDSKVVKKKEYEDLAVDSKGATRS